MKGEIEPFMETTKMIARGAFEVDLQPAEFSAAGRDGVGLYRMTINKTFSGDLSGRSQGEMLSAVTPVEGSAGYVAVEQVEGIIAGRRGTFVLQHYGLSRRGETSLVLEVVPDSGTGGLEGITGKMRILIEDGKHAYELEYSLPA